MKFIKHLAITLPTVIAASFLLSACGGGSSSSGNSSTSIKGDAATEAASKLESTCGLPNFNADMLARVNAVRAAGAVCGGEVMPPVGKVAWNEQLKNAATVQVLDMSTTGVQSHTGSNGSTAVSRAQAAGYASTYVGESIASGYGDAEAVMAGWMGSPPHCKGMMNAPFEEIGVSCMQHVSGKKYFAISLGSRNQ